MKLENSKEFDFDCDCGSHKIKIIDVQEDSVHEIFITHYISSFYAMQETWFTRLIERLKFVWFILRGKEYFLWEIVLQGEDAERFKSFMKEL